MTLIHFGKPKLLKHRYSDTVCLSKRICLGKKILFCFAQRSEHEDFQTELKALSFIFNKELF